MAAINPLLDLVLWLEQAAAAFLDERDAEGDPLRHRLVEMPADVRNEEAQIIESLTRWLHANANREGHKGISNLYDAALYLLNAEDGHVFLERIKGDKDEPDKVFVRFRRRHPLPIDREVFLLDATADPDLIRAILPGWDVHVWECLPVNQRGRVIQIMDWDVSRGRIRREVERHQPHNPGQLVQALDHILRTHGPMPVISFKKVTSDPTLEMDILGLLEHRDRITIRHNYPCRGHSFSDDALLILGTPYPDQLAYHELAHAIWGVDGLPASRYERRYEDHEGWSIGMMGYEEDHLRLLRDHFVSAELAQSVGRVRPLANDCTVFVVTNAPIPIWQVERVNADDLFDMLKPLRRDAADRLEAFAEALDGGEQPGGSSGKVIEINARTARRYRARLREQGRIEPERPDGYRAFSEAMGEMLQAGDWIRNAEVAEKLGLAERTTRNYLARYKEEHGKKLEVARGRIRLGDALLSA